jgi:transposase
MVQETARMSRKESERLRILERVRAKGLKLIEASELMGISYRHSKRLMRSVRKEGFRGLAHRLRGRPSNRRIDPAVRERILARYCERYADFKPGFASEKLAEEGLEVSSETLRRWLREAGLWEGRRARRAHRKRRARRKHFGELVQIDGSDHAWFEDRAARCCLMIMIDDATNRVQALFSPSESLRAALGVLEQWLLGFGGAPQALYSDRLSLYHPSREPNRAERRQGSRALSQFGQVCWNLGIEIIPAGSPQAKGRVERAGATLQDRLVKELRLASIASIEAANAFLQNGFLDRFNRQFGLEPLEAANYHRLVPPDVALRDLLCIETARQVQNDWTIQYEGKTLQILAQEHTPRAKSRVLVRERLDGSLVVLQGEHVLPFKDVTYMMRPQRDPLPTPSGVGKPDTLQSLDRLLRIAKSLAKRGATAPRASGPPPKERGHF